jgi:alanyl-tRNA synthetase
MTERLYYHDPYLTSFTAQIADVSEDGHRVYLDRTAFYPSSGGQPYDTGTLNGVPVLDVVDEENRVAHVLQSALPVRAVEGCIDWTRRLDHMQQHTGQHLLSAVLEELYSIPTISFHLGQESSTIDVSVPQVTAEQIVEAERRANEIVMENRAIVVTFEDAAVVQGLRKASDRSGTLRIVSIEGIDRSACGGTHVRSTASIGPIAIRKLDKIRGNVRIEFLCGRRALDRARADFEKLNETARQLSASLDDVPQLVAALNTRAQDLDKARRKVAIELAAFQGKHLYAETLAGDNGIRVVVKRQPKGAIDDELKSLAQGFTSGDKAVFLAVFEQPPALMLAASKDSGVNAGDLMKKALAAAGGRGGGNAQLAQGSVPSPDALDAVLRSLSDLSALVLSL